MADPKKITDLPTSGVPASDDVFEITDVSVPKSKQVTVEDLAAGIATGFAAGALAGSKIADSGITSSKIADDGVTANKIDWASTGANAGIWWEELGRVTLGSSSSTLNATGLAPRRYLRILVIAINSGSIDTSIRFNGDTGNNYAWRISSNGGADTTATSTSIVPGGTASSTLHVLTYDVLNVATQPKTVSGCHVSPGGTAATAPTRREMTGAWHNTSDSISSINCFNTVGGSFAAGSEIVVLGHN